MTNERMTKRERLNRGIDVFYIRFCERRRAGGQCAGDAIQSFVILV